MTGLPRLPETTFPTCRAHYPGGSSGCACRLLPRSCSLPQMAGGSASALSLSRPAQASHMLRPAGSLSRLKRSLSRGSSPSGDPAELLVSYQINRQLSGWNLPPQVIRAFGAHCRGQTYCEIISVASCRNWPQAATALHPSAGYQRAAGPLNHTVAVPCRLPKPPLQAPATWILTCPVPSVVADASPCSLALKMWPPPPACRADAGRPMFASCLLVSPFTESRTNCRPPWFSNRTSSVATINRSAFGGSAVKLNDVVWA